MDIQPRKPSSRGPAEWFTGHVWIDPIAQGQGSSRLSVGAVHFSPGARTAWHSHSLGQTLYVTEGEGRVQSAGRTGHDDPARRRRPHAVGGVALARRRTRPLHDAPLDDRGPRPVG